MKIASMSCWMVVVYGLVSGAQSARVQIYANALNEQDGPVRGLQTGDLVLRDGGVRQGVIDVEPAADPLSVAIVVSGFGSGDVPELTRAIDTAVTALHAANPATKVGVVGPGGDTTMIVAGQTGWQASLSQVVSTPGESFAEAIVAGCEALDIAPPDRRVILGIVRTHGAVAIAGVDRLAVTLVEHRVALWTVETGAAGPAAWTPAIDRALGAATEAGGALRVRLKTGETVAAGVSDVVDFLTSQYVVTYAWPDPMLSSFSLVTRHDAGTVLTPSWTAK